MKNATMMMNALPRLLAKRVPLRAISRPLYLSTVTMEEENEEPLDYFDTLGIEVGKSVVGCLLFVVVVVVVVVPLHLLSHYSL
jgi:hypothetical protein